MRKKNDDVESKPNIRDEVLRYIYATDQARFDEQDGVAGVVFLDENEFIPLSDLGYNADVGFFQISQFPHLESERTNESQWTVHPLITHDNWKGYIIQDGDGYGLMLGERWQVVEAAAALREFLEHGTVSYPIADGIHRFIQGHIS